MVFIKTITGKSIFPRVQGMTLVTYMKQNAQNITGIPTSLQSLIFSGKVLQDVVHFERLWYSKELYNYPEFKTTRWCPRSKHTSWIIFDWQEFDFVQGCIKRECCHTRQTKPKYDNPKSVHCRENGESPRSVHRITRSKWSLHYFASKSYRMSI